MSIQKHKMYMLSDEAAQVASHIEKLDAKILKAKNESSDWYRRYGDTMMLNASLQKKIKYQKYTIYSLLIIVFVLSCPLMW